MALPDNITPELHTYLTDLFGGDTPEHRHAIAAAQAAGMPAIAVGPNEGRFLAVVAAAVNARHALEIGTLAGYSGLWIARALPSDGRLVTIEAAPHHAAVAREVFKAARLDHMVEVRIGEGVTVLPELADEGMTFDLIFIDADKENYPVYLDWALKLARPGGAILAHNTYLDGAVIRDDGSARVKAMRTFNARLASDERLDSTLVPLRDGMSFSIVRHTGDAP